MSSDNMASKPAAASKDEGQRSGNGNKTPAATRPQQEQQALKCPRCDSSNTKFCYYNNYSLSQPRHFCKTCRRYWTKGGALRNVPIGGGCRKNKKVMKSSSCSSILSGDSREYSTSSSDIGGLRFFPGLSPAMDFQLGGINFPRLNSSTAGLFNQLSATSPAMAPNPCFSVDPSASSNSLFGFNFSFPSGNGGAQEMGNIASSIESLSSINQDLHWKLQQQRLGISSAPLENQIQKPQTILFQNLEISKPETFGSNSRKAEATEWFFGNNSYASSVNPTVTNTGGNGNENAGDSNRIQTWSNLNHYSALP